jgi:6-phosphofructokinase 1
MTARPKRIALLTGGGDCPGLNAVIRAVVKVAQNLHGAEVWGVRNGFEGFLAEEGGIAPITREAIAGILPRGGTILGASNRCDIFAVRNPDGTRRDESARVGRAMERLGIEALVVVGGDGTHTAALRLHRMGIPVVGVPKTIDDDLLGTDLTFGHDSAVAVVADAVDRLHTTAESHDRVMVVEAMGRNAGWIALRGGIAGGADAILIPEIPYDPDRVARRLEGRRSRGRRFSIVVVAEGAKTPNGDLVYRSGQGNDPIRDRLGGVSDRVRVEIARRVDLEVRHTILGHMQRGGSPTPFDRVLATRLGVEAVRLAAERRFGRMAALQGTEIGSVPIEEAVAGQKTVPPDGSLVRTARDLGITFAAADGSDDRHADLRDLHGTP